MFDFTVIFAFSVLKTCEFRIILAFSAVITYELYVIFAFIITYEFGIIFVLNMRASHVCTPGQIKSKIQLWYELT